MNNTTVVFAPAEKAFLPISVVPCLVLLWVLYKYGKKSLSNDETMEKRLEYFYSAISASLFGHFLFRIFPMVSTPQPFPAIVGVGFLIIYVIQKLALNWRDDEYSMLNDYDGVLLHSVDRENVQIKYEMLTDDLDDPNIPLNNKRMRLETDELRVRRRIVSLMFVTMIVTSVVEGFDLAANPQTVMVVMFYLARLVQTLTVGIGFLHAFFHGMEEGQPAWYFILSIFWCLATALSTIPALLDYQLLPIQSSFALLFIYSLSAGILLWISLYFIFLDRRENNLKRTLIRLVIFVIMFALTWIASFFI